MSVKLSISGVPGGLWNGIFKLRGMACACLAHCLCSLPYPQHSLVTGTVAAQQIFTEWKDGCFYEWIVRWHSGTLCVLSKVAQQNICFKSPVSWSDYEVHKDRERVCFISTTWCTVWQTVPTVTVCSVKIWINDSKSWCFNLWLLVSFKETGASHTDASQIPCGERAAWKGNNFILIVRLKGRRVSASWRQSELPLLWLETSLHLPSWPARSELGATLGFLLSISETSGSKWLRETEASRCSGALKNKQL